MKVQINLLIVALLSFVLFSCNSSTTNVEENTSFEDEHNAFNSLDYEGVYEGVLPCADCEGIQTTLYLTKELDYKLERKYLGKSDEVFAVKGTAQKLDGNTFQLNEVEGANQYFVSENYLIQLDVNGEKITGDLAESFILKKTSNPTEYLLIELNGNEIKLERPITFTYNEEEKRINGFAGCNNFFGSYEILDDNKVKSGPMASTMMACADEKVSKTEYEFLQMWEKVSGYHLHENELILLDSDFNKIAIFNQLN